MPIRKNRPGVTSRIRLRGYDYGSPGTYFVTICTSRRACFFGDVVDGMLRPSMSGTMVESWWYSIPRRYPTVRASDMIVMPNHLHGLILLGADPNAVSAEPVPSLSDVIGWFKSITTNDYMLGVKTLGWPKFPGTLWQTGFNDHIVRNERALERIRKYIAANPSHWPDDDLHPSKIGT